MFYEFCLLNQKLFNESGNQNKSSQYKDAKPLIEYWSGYKSETKIYE